MKAVMLHESCMKTWHMLPKTSRKDAMLRCVIHSTGGIMSFASCFQKAPLT